MTKHYKTAILLIEFDPDRPFMLQVCVLACLPACLPACHVTLGSLGCAFKGVSALHLHCTSCTYLYAPAYSRHTFYVLSRILLDSPTASIGAGGRHRCSSCGQPIGAAPAAFPTFEAGVVPQVCVGVRGVGGM